MADQPGTLESLAEELGLALSSLEGALTPQNVAALLVELGLDAAPELTGDPAFTQTLEKAGQRAGALFPAIEALSKARETDDDHATVEALRLLLAAINDLVKALDQLSTDLVHATATLPNATDLESFALTFVERLLAYAFIGHLELTHPFLRRILSLVSVIELSTTIVTVDEVPTTLTRKRLHLKRISQLLNDPRAVFHDAYGWGDDGFDGKALFANVRDVFDTLLPLATTHDADEDGPADLDLFGFLVRAAADAKPPGLEMKIFADPTGHVDQTLGQFSENCRVALQIEGGLTDDVALRLLPPANLEVKAGSNIAGRVALMVLADSTEPSKKLVLFGESGGSGLQAAHVSAGLVADLAYDVASNKSKADLRFEAKCTEGVLFIDPNAFDGLLKSVLPPEGIRAPFTAGLVLSSAHGLTFTGSAGLDATFTVGLSVGPVTISLVHVSLIPSDAGVTVEVSASVGVSLGPASTVIDHVGIATVVTFPSNGGNLGVADLDFHFKPPDGLGVSIDAAIVSGGGYLRFDSRKEEYSGMLQLRIAEKISVTAIGLLTTRMPDGSKGYSLVIIIFVEGFTPIQLGFGFSLTAIGGLLAINRTFDENVLRSGLKNHILDSVMFPKDPVRNAPQIISNLNKIFPPANGHHLFGPMVQIAWGSPPLITANIALVLEFGARLRLLILGQVQAILPKPENDLVRIQMDSIGIIDFDQGTAALDATLHDSRLVNKFVLTGDMAMRMQWKSSPNFALAVGGFHPAFNPPPNFPKLERISINLCSGNNPRFRCEAYFAVTSNTVQFGSRAELYAEAHGFNIQGGVGYDVLIQFDPFQFIAEFDAHIQLRRNSTNLFSVRVKGALSGPRPLHLKAKATFSIFWWDISIPVNLTLVEGEKPPLPAPIDVLPRLKEALQNRGNWVSQLPNRQQEVATLRPNSWAANDVLLHPLGTLTVKQTVVPLNFEISRFGQGPPAGDRHFTVNVASGSFAQSPDSVKDFFAPAQFIEMTDDEKLSRPSFESMDAGLTIGSNRIDLTPKDGDWLEVEAIRFETKIIDAESNVATPADPTDATGKKILYELSNDLLLKHARFGAAANSATRRTGEAKYRTSIRKYSLAKEGWTMVAVEDLAVQPVPAVAANKPATYSELEQELRELKQRDPAKAAGLKILRPSDLARN